MLARKYYVEVVLPALTDFLNYYASRTIGMRKDITNAGNLAEALLNLPEYIYEKIPDISNKHAKAHNYRESFWEKHRFYEYTCDFANAWKHGFITRDNRTLSSITDAREYIAWIRYEDDLGYYYASSKFIGVKTKEDLNLKLEDALYASFELWTNELISFEIIPCMPRIPIIRDIFIDRGTAERQTPIKVIGQVQERMEIGNISFVYRQSTQAIDDVSEDDKFKFSGEFTIDILPSIFPNNVNGSEK